jgi:geranylgeranyl diphosphate synthase type II
MANAPLVKAPNSETRLGSTWSLERFEDTLREWVEGALSPTTPPQLGRATLHAVFPGGARLRPQLTIVAARASGASEAQVEAVFAAAAAVELLHCASLVHDDLPCFDDADTRRGKPTVHVAFSQPTAVLTGDGLIMMAFEVLARGFANAGGDVAGAIALLAEGAGVTRGIVAGQAWEQEVSIPLAEYHRAKTAALFECAAALGALAGGGRPSAWRRFGEFVGRAYQAADDLRDAAGDTQALGKPTGRDVALGRPSLVRAHGLQLARTKMVELLDEVVDAIPLCERREVATAWLRQFAAPLLEERVG